MDIPAATAENAFRPLLADAPSFIERQFPVSLVSKESYRERKAGDGQTLTPLGTYWKGRKPLVLVRAVLFGLLLPATEDPAKDRDIFLKLMLMDRDGLKRRKSEPIAPDRAAQLLPAALHAEAFELDSRTGKRRWRRSLPRIRRDELELLAFERMSTDEKLDHCRRIEEMAEDAWAPVWPEVNAHLGRFGIKAASLTDLVEQLGLARFGHRPRVGDPFCGGGSIPFEAARLGCDVYASDLNPIACMLTWGALNIIGAPPETRARIAEAQREVARAVDAEITAMGVEHDGEDGDLRLPADAPHKWPHGWRVDRSGQPVPPEAEPYQVRCPHTGWLVPMLETLQVHERSRTILRLIPDPSRRAYRLKPEQGVSDAAWRAAATGTVVQQEGGPGGVTFYLRHDPGEGEVRVRIANRAKAFLYCLETRCPRTGWLVPLLPRRDISEKLGVVAVLEPDHARQRFRIRVVSGMPDADVTRAKEDGTVKDRALAYVLDGQRHVHPSPLCAATLPCAAAMPRRTRKRRTAPATRPAPTSMPRMRQTCCGGGRSRTSPRGRTTSGRRGCIVSSGSARTGRCSSPR
jgi:adenine-specific DNA methylase